jgi:L-threonylcarbamoyladenylate synthase
MAPSLNVVPVDAPGISQAAEILRAGGLVAFPTETVYGLGADATSDRAVAGIFEAKGRPRFNPLIVHVRDADSSRELVKFVPVAERLADAFWPGPLTLVLPRKPDCPLSLLVSAGLDTVAVRVPANSIVQQLLAALDRPIAAPSANRSGHVSATTAQHVAEDLEDRVDLVLDGGATIGGVESTIVGFENDTAIILRPGAISRQELEAVAGRVAATAGKTIASPGQLASHYAPRALLRLNVTEVYNDEALLAFGSGTIAGGSTVLNLSPSGDLKEAAANLFAMLRTLDSDDIRRIAVMPIPEHGLGEAINDRLRRAAAPRVSK